jgi:hypothetical protein
VKNNTKSANNLTISTSSFSHSTKSKKDRHTLSEAKKKNLNSITPQKWLFIAISDEKNAFSFGRMQSKDILFGILADNGQLAK